MNFDKFKQKYGSFALVAGGSDGLGFAFAEAAARRGLNLVLLARGKERLEQAGATLREKYGIEVITHAIDLADFAGVKKFVEGLTVPIGLLIYNAAYAPIGLFENVGETQLSLAADVNVKTPLLLAKLMSKKMVENKRGGIVLMSSLAGTQGSPRLATYAATKSFNAILAEGLWAELKPHNVDVIASIAGAISTPNYKVAEKTKPAIGTLPPDVVAERTLRALGKKPIVVVGFINKVGRFLLMRVLPRKAAIKIMSKNTGGLS